MTREIHTVAVLGAGGTMGLPIARNLARAGFEVRGWNRTPEKAQPLSDDGVTVVDSPAAAARQADAILTMLSDSGAVIEAASAALTDDIHPRAVWLQMSTIGEHGTELCSALAHERGVRLVDAPVLGTKAPAEQGELVVLASGAADLRTPLAPLFDAIGKRTMWVGEAGAGTRLKLATNSWVLTVVEGGAEMLAFAEGLGLDPQLVLDAIADGPLDSPYLRIKAKAIADRNFEPSFRLALAAKDAELIEEAAVQRDLDLPLFKTITERLYEGAREHGDKDMCATYLTSARSPARD